MALTFKKPGVEVAAPGQWHTVDFDDKSTWPPPNVYVITNTAYGGFVDFRWLDWMKDGQPDYQLDDLGASACEPLTRALFHGRAWFQPPTPPEYVPPGDQDGDDSE